MLDGLLPNTTSELLSILDFIKQSPEGMLALERHLLGLEDVNAFAEASGILEQVCLDLSILKPPRVQRHAIGHQSGGLARARTDAVLGHMREDFMRAETEKMHGSRGAGAGSGIIADADARLGSHGTADGIGPGIGIGGKRSRDASFNEPSTGMDHPLRRPKASRASHPSFSNGSMPMSGSHGAPSPAQALPGPGNASHVGLGAGGVNRGINSPSPHAQNATMFANMGSPAANAAAASSPRRRRRRRRRRLEALPRWASVRRRRRTRSTRCSRWRRQCRTTRRRRRR